MKLFDPVILTLDGHIRPQVAVSHPVLRDAVTAAGVRAVLIRDADGRFVARLEIPGVAPCERPEVAAYELLVRVKPFLGLRTFDEIVVAFESLAATYLDTP